MKTFDIYYFDQEIQKLDKSCLSANVQAESELDALRKWYLHINTLAGNFKNFVYGSVQAIKL